MEYINYKKLNIKVRVLSLKKNGVVLARQPDFYNNLFWIVKIGREIMPFKTEELKFISSDYKKYEK